MEQERYTTVCSELRMKVRLKKQLVEINQELEKRHESNNQGMSYSHKLSSMLDDVYDGFQEQVRETRNELVRVEMELMSQGLDFRNNERMGSEYVEELNLKKRKLKWKSDQLMIKINEVETNQNMNIQLWNAFSMALPSQNSRRKNDDDIYELTCDIIKLRAEMRHLRTELGINGEEISDAEE